jgi:hypothetical protein
VLTPDEDRVEDTEDGEPEGHAEPAPIAKFQRSAVGSMLAAGLIGIQEAIDPPKDETPAIVESWGGLPVNDDMLMRLDPDNPQDSIVMIKRPAEGSSDEGPSGDLPLPPYTPRR